MSADQSPDDPLVGNLEALEEENAELRAQLERVLASRSYKLGNGLVRAAAKVLPGRESGPPPVVPPPAVAPRSQRRPERAFGVVLTADDVLIDGEGLPLDAVRQLVARLRSQLPAHATIVVAHEDETVVQPDDVTLRIAPPDLRRYAPRFGGARTLRLVEVGGQTAWVAAPPRPLLRRTSDDEHTSAELPGLPDGPVFIGGTGRSGTWVIGRMLAAHPRFTTVHTELRFHSSSPGFAQVLSGDLEPDAFARTVQRRWYRPTGGSGKPKGLQLLLGPAGLRWALDRFVVRARTDVPGALGQLMLDIVDPYAASRDAVNWAETTPDNASAAAALTAALPTARVVHTVRDGRDVAASVATMPWGPDTIEEGLEWWATRIRRAHAGAEGADPSRLHVVRLEELLYLDRDRRFTELVGFLGFEDDARLRRYFDEQMDGKGGHVGRWRGQVSDDERDRVDGRYRQIVDELRAEGVTCLPTDVDAIDDLAARPAGDAST
jgi:hypothetical protein